MNNQFVRGQSPIALKQRGTDPAKKLPDLMVKTAFYYLPATCKRVSALFRDAFARF